MQKILSSSALFLGMIFFCIPPALASSEKNFLFLKNQVNQEINLTELGLKNKNFLEFKAFEYEDSQIFQLGLINKTVLTDILDSEKQYSSYANAIENTTKNFAQIDIWEYLAMQEKTETREKAMEEYLFLANDSLQKGETRQKFLENFLNTLKTKISRQQDRVNELEKNFPAVLESQDENALVQKKAELLKENKVLKTMQIEFSEKKYQYNTISPSVKTLKNKIQAIEENKDALIKNVKTKKSSGEFIGTVVE